ncbi:hypothetical protein LWI29_026607 [Acer saccharum]|uniref:Protein FAR1-RELATED SEQUENCE n=1 Tax=Acer saccharum TaxID=4024 RepID=A0AA39S1X9_ACESA|nr:hypothetical protein LWI29_026607 [Acer saccharum]
MLWVVTEFVTEHSHKLSSGDHSQFLRSHRNVKYCDIAQVQSLRSVGMKTYQVMDQLLDQCGSYAAVGHTRKDLQNRLDTIRRSASHNSDADSIISYMTVKSEMDPGFFFRYTILEDGSMDEIKSEAKLSIVNCVDDMESVMYTFKKFAGGDKTWNVSVIKAMNQHRIPETLIMKRWTMNAKDVSEVKSSSTATTPNIMQIARYGALSSKCNRMSYYALMPTEGYKEANVAIDKLTIKMKRLLLLSSTTREENVHCTRTQSGVQIEDPVIAATKGSMRQNKNCSGKTHKCGNYGQPGHTKKTCCAHVNNNISAMASNGAARTGSALQPTAYADLVQSCDSKYIVDSNGHC